MQPIYVLDDSADQRLLLGYFLNRINPEYEVVFFDRAQSLLNSLTSVNGNKAAFPLVIIMDFQMPGLDGYQTLQIIKQSDHNTKWKDVPVVLYSGMTDPELIKKCMNAGALAFLNKPIDMDQLKNLLTEI